ERESARQAGVLAAGEAGGRARPSEIRIAVRGEARAEAGANKTEVDEARAERDTLGGGVEVRARGVPPGLGSYATKEDRLDARLAAAFMGIQAVKGVEIGEGFELADL